MKNGLPATPLSKLKINRELFLKNSVGELLHSCESDKIMSSLQDFFSVFARFSETFNHSRHIIDTQVFL
jgi:hypothetical protein